MKLKALVFAAAAAALTTTTAFAATQAFRVNGDLITKTEQEDMIKAATARGQQRTEELENQVKQLLTQQSVLVQEAKKQRLDRKSDVRRTIERARESILMQALVEDYLKKNPVPESDVRALFDAEKKRWGDTEVQVRHILVKDQATAEKLLKDLKGGADFAKLAKEQSVDTQENRNAGGLIPWTSANLFDKDFAAGFAGLKAGELAKAPVKSRLGWHVVKLEGKRAARRFADYNAWAPQFKQLLAQQKVQQYVAGLVKKAKVTPLK